MNSLIGQSLGRYHILEQLGEGGMAIVYKAYDTRLERDVAVKVIRVDQFAPAVLERILKRFEREAKSLARLTHPNIVSVIDYGDYEGAPFLVMPYMPGKTLKQKLGEPIPWQTALRMILPIASALEYAHQHNVIHRDIKPSNILLTESNQPMLSDFGIAKILENDESATLTGTGMGVGTPEYMAPEQWTGNAGAQADIYSLGVVLYEMVTGRKPYQADTPAAILLKQANDPLPRPVLFAPDLPEEMEHILLKALSKNVKDRYQDMAGFSEAMENLTKIFSGKQQIQTPVAGHTTKVRKLSNSKPEKQKKNSENDVTKDEYQIKSLSKFMSPMKIILALTGLVSVGLILYWFAGRFPAISSTNKHNTVSPTSAPDLSSTRTSTATQSGTLTPEKTVIKISSTTPTSLPSLTPSASMTSTNSIQATATPMVFSFNQANRTENINLNINLQCVLFINQFWGTSAKVTIYLHNKVVAEVYQTQSLLVAENRYLIKGPLIIDQGKTTFFTPETGRYEVVTKTIREREGITYYSDELSANMVCNPYFSTATP